MFSLCGTLEDPRIMPLPLPLPVPLPVVMVVVVVAENEGDGFSFVPLLGGIPTSIFNPDRRRLYPRPSGQHRLCFEPVSLVSHRALADVISKGVMDCHFPRNRTLRGISGFALPFLAVLTVLVVLILACYDAEAAISFGDWTWSPYLIPWISDWG